MRGLSLVVVSGGHSSSRCAGLSLLRPLVAEHRLQTRRISSCGSRAQLLCGMWDLPRPGLEPVSPALAGRFSTTAPPGKPNLYFNIAWFQVWKEAERNPLSLGPWGSPTWAFERFHVRAFPWIRSWNSLEHLIWERHQASCEMLGSLRRWVRLRFCSQEERR